MQWAGLQRNLLRSILTFLEITSWHIELVRVCKDWYMCVPNYKDKIYQDAVARERKDPSDVFMGRHKKPWMSPLRCHGLRGDGYMTIVRGGPPVMCSRAPLTLIAKDWTDRMSPCCSNCDINIVNGPKIQVGIKFDPYGNLEHDWLNGCRSIRTPFTGPFDLYVHLCSKCFKAQAEIRRSQHGQCDFYALVDPKVITVHGITLQTAHRGLTAGPYLLVSEDEASV